MNYNSLAGRAGIPNLSQDEQIYYRKLVRDAADVIGVPKIIKRSESWLKSDEQKRLIWYFMAQSLARDSGLLNAMEAELTGWKNDPEISETCYSFWLGIYYQLKQGDSEALYDRSFVLNYGNQKTPFQFFQFDQKLRLMIIIEIAGRLERDRK